IHVHVRDMLQDQIQKPFDQALNKEVNKVASRSDLKAEVQKAWEHLHQRQLVGKNPEIWMTCNPEYLKYENLHTEKSGDCVLAIGMRAQLKFFVGNTPEKPQIKPLPKPQRINGVNGKMDFTVPVAIDLATINDRLGDLSGRQFTFDNRCMVQVTEISLTSGPSQDYLTAQVGVLYQEPIGATETLKKKLSWDIKPTLGNDRRVSLVDMAESREQDDLPLVCFGHREAILKAMSEIPIFDLNEHLQRAQRELNEGINRLSQNSSTSLDAEVKLITPLQCEVGPGEIIVNCQSKGQANLRLNNFHILKKN
ncbi:MAG: DUF4403 family protein, partial [Pseudomonadota bacterium]